MHYVSEKLKSTRAQKELSIDIVSYETNLNKQHLMWIESSEWDKFDSKSDCLYCVKIYANYLQLNGENLVKILDRDISTSPKAIKRTIVKKQLTYSRKDKKSLFIDKIKVFWNEKSKLFLSKISISITVGFFTFLFFYVLFVNNTKPAIIHLEYPVETILESNVNITLSAKNVVFKGQVQGFGELKINGKIVEQKPGGFFETDKFLLNQRENKFLFQTRNIFDEKTEKVLTITRQDLQPISTEPNFITVVTGEKARFVLIRIDGEIVYNDTVIPNQNLGFEITETITIETSEFKEFKLNYKGIEYKINSAIEHYKIIDEKLTKL